MKGTRKRQTERGHPFEGRTKADHPGIAKAAKKKEGSGNPNYGKFGVQAPGWKGGRWSDKRGYVFVRSNGHPHRPTNNYMLEHILVAEQQVGRLLEHKEVVHHINGIKFDNRAENLWICKQAAHRKAHHSAEQVAMKLVTAGIIGFNRDTGEYFWPIS